jgi:hypothetical protein
LTYISVVDLEIRHAGLLDGLFEVLGEKLALLVEIVASTLVIHFPVNS